jgi:hypothetical protein
MYVRLTIGVTGNPTNPFTVPLPTWQAIAIDVTTARGIVDVPVTDMPDDVRAWVIANPVVSLILPVTLTMPQSLTSSWWRWLDATYQESATKYRPEIA